VILFVSGGFSLLAGRAWLAEYWNDTPNPELWEKAAKLEPENANYWQHLGIYHESILFPADERRALVEFQKAAQVNPRSAEAWLGIARASENLGDSGAARAAYERAQSCHPISAAVAWQYGSFLIRQSELPAAYSEIRRSVQAEPSLTLSAISQFWEAGQGAREILDGLAPMSTEEYATALGFFTSRGQAASALEVWQRMLQRHEPVKVAQALQLVDELMREDQIADATRTWREALRATDWPNGAQAGGSLIFDGGFDYEAVNGGFGWREIPIRGVHYAFDTSVVHSGVRSLRLTFDGTANLDFAQIQQYVAVEPARRYRFSACLRTEKISTESGVGFEIEDPRNPGAMGVYTRNLTGTNPWTAVEAEFETGARTHLLLVSVRRTPSNKLDNRISGTAWVDDVLLRPVEGRGKLQP
jgi:hypothetical protein